MKRLSKTKITILVTIALLGGCEKSADVKEPQKISQLATSSPLPAVNPVQSPPTAEQVFKKRVNDDKVLQGFYRKLESFESDANKAGECGSGGCFDAKSEAVRKKMQKAGYVEIKFPADCDANGCSAWAHKSWPEAHAYSEFIEKKSDEEFSFIAANIGPLMAKQVYGVMTKTGADGDMLANIATVKFGCQVAKQVLATKGYTAAQLQDWLKKPHGNQLASNDPLAWKALLVASEVLSGGFSKECAKVDG